MAESASGDATVPLMPRIRIATFWYTLCDDPGVPGHRHMCSCGTFAPENDQPTIYESTEN